MPYMLVVQDENEARDYLTHAQAAEAARQHWILRTGAGKNAPLLWSNARADSCHEWTAHNGFYRVVYWREVSSQG